MCNCVDVNADELYENLCGAVARSPSCGMICGITPLSRKFKVSHLEEEEAEWDREFAYAKQKLKQAEDDFASKPWGIVYQKAITTQIEAELRAKYEKEAADQAEALEKAKEFIASHLLAAGESVEFSDAVLALVQRGDCKTRLSSRGAELLNAIAGGNHSTAALNAFVLDVKNDSLLGLRDKLWSRFPTWSLTELQKGAVIDRTFAMFSSSDLIALEPQLSHYENALLEEVSQNVAFQCLICMDPLVVRKPDGAIDTSNIWFAQQRKTEHWSNIPCGHTSCRSCMSRWAETGIDEHKLRIKCPAAGCSYSLWQQDLQELVSEESFKRHQEHKNADYLKHLKACVKDDACLKMWLKSNARPCPECHVIVSRSEGCNAMMCVCGTRFCYKCGFKKCKCGSSGKRANIWNPLV